MEQLFVEVGLEISNTKVKPAPFSNEQIQKLATKIGKGKYAFAEYEKLDRIIMPLGDTTFFV